eukprot:14979170-Alexandrium_andersonii.AAC.1
MARCPGKFILRTDEEMASLGEDDSVRPYSDPALWRRQHLLELARRARGLGRIAFRPAARAKLGLLR